MFPRFEDKYFSLLPQKRKSDSSLMPLFAFARELSIYERPSFFIFR